LLVLDEAWTFLDDALFAARIREWLKTLRNMLEAGQRWQEDAPTPLA